MPGFVEGQGHTAQRAEGETRIWSLLSPCHSKDMAKVTSKLQVTVPKAVADRLGIRPGDEIEWHVEGDSARVVRAWTTSRHSLAERLTVFDDATRRQDHRNRAWAQARRTRPSVDRGWTREELYTRGRRR